MNKEKYFEEPVDLNHKSLLEFDWKLVERTCPKKFKQVLCIFSCSIVMWLHLKMTENFLKKINLEKIYLKKNIKKFISQ